MFLGRCLDFNMVLCSSERSGRSASGSCIEDFVETSNELNLTDLPLPGGRWMWSYSRDTPPFSGINRFVVSPSFQEQASDLF